MRIARPAEGQERADCRQTTDHGRRRLADAAAWIARGVVLAAVLAAPWLIGAVEAWVQVWIFGFVVVALALVGVNLALRGPHRPLPPLPLALVPLLLAIGLGIFHLIPLDQGLLGRLSPKARAIADDFLPAADPLVETPGGGPAGAAASTSGPDRRALSVYPTASRSGLALLILASSVFFLSAILFSRPESHLWLCGLIAANGAAIAFFGLAQKLTFNGQLYWGIVLTQGGGPFGPFVNRNNGGGYMVLCLAAAVGMALWCLAHYFGRQSSSAHGWYGPGPAARFRLRVLSAVANLNARTLTWLTIAGLLVAAVCCTLSRGAVLAMLAAVLATVAVMVASQRRGLAIVWPVAAMGVGLLLIGWVGMSDDVGARLATLFDDEIIHEARLPHWEDGLAAAADFWQTGSGLGTYRFTYRPYQHRLAQSWFYYAENVYLQVLVEAGAAGIALLLTGLGLVAAAIWRLLTRGRDLRTLAFGIAGVFALAGQSVAALFDFGLLIPANFLLFALVCGALSGSAARLSRVGGPRMSATRRVAAAALSVALLAGCVWGRGEVRAAVPGEKALREVRLAGPLQRLSVPQLDGHIESLTAACQGRPDDAELHRRLAELWMQRYQTRTIAELLEKTSFAPDDPRLAQLASPLLVHQRAYLFRRLNMPGELDALRRSPPVQENLLPALSHLVAARQACPTLADVHAGLAQLCSLKGPAFDDQVHVHRARRLHPGDPDLLYVCGLLDFQAGRIAAALAGWKASLALAPRYLNDIVQIAGARLAEPGGIAQLLPDSPELLVRLARREFADDATIRDRLLARAEEILPQSDLAEAERLYLAGAIGALRNDYPQAIDYYLRAVALRSRQVAWRYELAQLLQQQGRLEEAREQARWCARLEPKQARHKRLLEEIHYARLTE